MQREKARRLEQIARLYYQQDKTQNEIAELLGVSRPLISRMLREAREAGIVEIRIRPASAESENALLGRAMERFGLLGGALVPEASEDKVANQAIAQAAIDLVRALGGGRLGIGWGHIIGTVVELYEQQPPQQDAVTDVCPLVGNSGISIRNYHSNENVRIVAHHAMAVPHYLHTPAIAESRRELELLMQTENYRAVHGEWQRLDVALVNIGNHPSTPDFASFARYGGLLVEQRAVGRLIAYYFNQAGEIIRSESDCAVQIPLSLLAGSRYVVGVCSANVNAQALEGALRSGLLSHLVAREELVRQMLEHM